MWLIIILKILILVIWYIIVERWYLENVENECVNGDQSECYNDRKGMIRKVIQICITIIVLMDISIITIGLNHLKLGMMLILKTVQTSRITIEIKWMYLLMMGLGVAINIWTVSVISRNNSLTMSSSVILNTFSLILYRLLLNFLLNISSMLTSISLS